MYTVTKILAGHELCHDAQEVKKASFVFIAFLLCLSLAEGVSSLSLLLSDLLYRRPDAIAEQKHSEFDPNLGWINLPSVFLPDMYGKGVFLRTNAQRFRGSEDYETAVPEGKCRIVCSGDSFTLGYSVDDDHTWVNLLQESDRRLQTVNMGQGGYGPDQAYLWYERDGTKLDHDVQIFAVISYQFKRMETGYFEGYTKPKLGLRSGELVVENSPLKEAILYPYGVRFFRLIQPLGLVRGATAVSTRLHLSANRETGPGMGPGSMAPVVLKVFEKLRELNDQKHSVLVVAYLPVADDYYTGNSDKWRAFLTEELRNRGVYFIDLITEFRTWPFEQVVRMFVDSAKSGKLTDGGHYTEKGNKAISDALYERLVALPEVAAKLKALDSGTP